MDKGVSTVIGNQKIAIPTKKGFIFIRPNDIIRCESNKKYSICILKNKMQEELSLSMKETESMLKSHGFLRVHHAHLININHIEKYEKAKDSYSGGLVTMSSGETVAISKRKKSNFKIQMKKEFDTNS